MRVCLNLAAILFLILSFSLLPAHARAVFDRTGTAMVDGKPFFPVGIYLYDFNSNVLAEVTQQGFNTVVWGITPKDMDTLKSHALMTIPHATDEWLALKDHPSILAWYMADEPEGWGKTPEMMRKEYEKLRATDPNHPIALCHYLWDALSKYKDCCDVVLSDVYPVIAHRDQPITPVSDHIDQARKIHGANFPIWPVIQVFGGPDTDGGKWAEPTPAEVRCMTYLALSHGAKGIFFFSYWPRLPRTWAEVGKLCKELHQLTPFLVLPGSEPKMSSSEAAIHTRSIRIGSSGIVLAVNSTPAFHSVKLKVADLQAKQLEMPFENRRVRVNKGEISDRFMPYEVHVYQWGDTPEL